MSNRSIETIGFIGLGVMGEAMCRNLVTSGRWSVLAFDLKAAPLARIEQDGADIASSVADLAQASDLIITCLPGSADVKELVLGKGDLMHHLFDGQALIDMSTSEPSLMREIAERATTRGVGFADAPIARTRQAAIDGTLAIMVGATSALFDRIEPILTTMGNEIIRCGDVGAGQVVKIMNNMVLFQSVLALAEALTIAEGSGVEGSVLLETMAKSSADSFALRNHGMGSLLADNYPEKAFSVRYALKDLSYALTMAKEIGLDASGAANVEKAFEQAIQKGDGDRYFPVIRESLLAATENEPPVS